MTDMDEKAMDGAVEAISDDEMGAVAGGMADGGVTPEQAKAQALADGRPDKLIQPLGKGLCSCDDNYKWCKRVPVSIRLGKYVMPSYEYTDQKCYKCGATKQK